MVRHIMQYRVFIGSPGGLETERKRFQGALDKVSRTHGAHHGIHFHPVGWEDTLNGAGRPQTIINAEIEDCDYAVFVLHDRWGTAPGGRFTSGTEEEFRLAERLYKANKIRQIALFFKQVDPRQARDPGGQLKQVLAFRQRIVNGRQYLFKSYDTVDEFGDVLDAHLARWLKDHTDRKSAPSASGLATGDTGTPRTAVPVVTPGFDYWMAEANKLLEAQPPRYAGALFCATKATDTAESDGEWARAQNTSGAARFHLGELGEAAAIFASIAGRFLGADDPAHRLWQAKALVNQGITLAALGRGEAAIAVYDDLLARFGEATEAPLRELVAKAKSLKARLR